MKFVFAILLFCSCHHGFAQAIKFKSNWGYDASDNAYAKKRFYVSLGYGLPKLLKKEYHAFEENGNYTFKAFGPLNVKVEYSLTNFIGITAAFSYTKGSSSWGEKYVDSSTKSVYVFTKGIKMENKSIWLGIHSHGFTNDFIDIYIGANVGYRMLSQTPFSENEFIKIVPTAPKIDPLVYFGYLGFRGFLGKKTAAFAEAGLGNEYNASIGLLYRFGL